MDMTLFTGFDGRINRQKWWLGIIVILVAVIILYFVIMAVFGMSMMASYDPSAGPEVMVSMMLKAAIGQLVLIAIIAYPATALMKKRLNDRDRPAWYVYLFWAPTVLSLLLALTGMGYSMSDIGGVQVPMPSTIAWIINVAGIVIGLWALVELGFLKGTAGPNQHGPDPLGA